MLRDLRLTPVLSGLGKEYAISGELYGGSFQSMLSIAPFAGHLALRDLRLDNVQLEKFTYLHAVTRRTITGVLSGRGRFDGSWQRQRKIRAQGALSLRNGSVNLLQPILSLTEIDFERLAMDFALTGGELKVTGGKLGGTELEAEFSGALHPESRLESWGIGLTGNLAVHRVYLRKYPRMVQVVRGLQQMYGGNALPFAIKGTVGDPRFAFREH